MNRLTVKEQKQLIETVNKLLEINKNTYFILMEISKKLSD
jgi:hypothetical protein